MDCDMVAYATSCNVMPIELEDSLGPTREIGRKVKCIPQNLASALPGLTHLLFVQATRTTARDIPINMVW